MSYNPKNENKSHEFDEEDESYDYEGWNDDDNNGDGEDEDWNNDDDNFDSDDEDDEDEWDDETDENEDLDDEDDDDENRETTINGIPYSSYSEDDGRNRAGLMRLFTIILAGAIIVSVLLWGKSLLFRMEDLLQKNIPAFQTENTKTEDADKYVYKTDDNEERETEKTTNKDKDQGAPDTYTITDSFYYENLEPGREYTLRGRAIEKEAGTEVPLRITGAKGDAESISYDADRVTFVPSKKNGEIVIYFTYDGSEPAAGFGNTGATGRAVPQEERGANGIIADALKEEQPLLSDEAVYLVRIGYRFDDGSFDEWESGTALLAGYIDDQKYLITRQELADISASSALATRIKSEREDIYKRIGVCFSNDTITEAHMRVRVIDTNGNEEDVAGIKFKNGLALITLRTSPPVPSCVFATNTSPAELQGHEVGVKAAVRTAENFDGSNEVRTFAGEVIAPSDGSDGLYVSADMSGVSAAGGILYDSSGHVVGIIAGEGDEKPCFTVHAIQKFLSVNGVAYRTSSQIEE